MIRLLSVLHGNTFGGPHNRNAQLAPRLAVLHGIDTLILLPDEPGNGAERLRAAGLRVAQLPIPRLRATLSPRPHWQFALGFRDTVRAIETLLVQERIDLVQINGVSNPHAAIAARRHGLPVVWQILDTVTPPSFRRLIMPYVRRTAGAVMSTGRRVAAAHPGALSLGERLVLFHPPVDTNRFRPSAETRKAVRKALGFDERTFVIGNVSNLNRQKGHRTFVRAAAELRKRRPDTRFVIFGKRYQAHAQYFASLIEEAASLGLRVGEDLLVQDPEDRVAELAQAFDLFWMTPEPRSEGIPTVIEEAMALGLPVVAADAGSIGEIVLNGETGFLVAPRAASDVAERSLALLDNYELRERMSRRARAYAGEHFPVERCVDRHLQAYRIALGACCGDALIDSPSGRETVPSEIGE